MHPITIKIAESTYNAAKEKAKSRGYMSVEEYVSDWLESDAAFELPMTPEIVAALDEGIADSQSDHVMSLEEHNRRHAERRAEWIRAQQA